MDRLVDIRHRHFVADIRKIRTRRNAAPQRHVARTAFSVAEEKLLARRTISRHGGFRSRRAQRTNISRYRRKFPSAD